MADKPSKPTLWSEEFVRSLAIPEELLPPSARGNYWRNFASPNIIDLVPIIRRREFKQTPDTDGGQAA
jgi:hypothetical protein